MKLKRILAIALTIALAASTNVFAQGLDAFASQPTNHQSELLDELEAEGVPAENIIINGSTVIVNGDTINEKSMQRGVLESKTGYFTVDDYNRGFVGHIKVTVNGVFDSTQVSISSFSITTEKANYNLKIKEYWLQNNNTVSPIIYINFEFDGLNYTVRRSCSASIYRTGLIQVDG